MARSSLLLEVKRRGEGHFIGNKYLCSNTDVLESTRAKAQEQTSSHFSFSK